MPTIYDMTIALHKSVITHDLITPTILPTIKKAEYKISRDIYYYKLNILYEHTLKEIEEFFISLNSLLEVTPPLNSYILPGYKIFPYGAIRLGEEYGDVKYYGAYLEYGLYIQTQICFPSS